MLQRSATAIAAASSNHPARLRPPTEPDHSFTWIPHCLTVLSCERGDVRVGRESIVVYGAEQRQEMPVRREDRPGTVASDFYDAIALERRPVYDGRWGKANLEVCLAIEESARTGTDVLLSHQVPMGDWT